MYRKSCNFKWNVLVNINYIIIIINILIKNLEYHIYIYVNLIKFSFLSCEKKVCYSKYLHKVFFILVKNKKFKLDSLFSRMCRSIFFFFAIVIVDKTNKLYFVVSNIYIIIYFVF
jgi:hypothetical protein